jgi:hypothetical protein
MKFIFFNSFALLVISACGSSNAEVSDEPEQEKITIDSVQTDSIQLIEMFPEVSYDELSESEEYIAESMLCFVGKIGKNAIEMQVSINDDPGTGRYIYTDNPKSNFKVYGQYFEDNDSIFFERVKDKEVVETFKAISKNGTTYKGLWIKNTDTLDLVLELIKANPSETQFLVNNNPILNLSHTKNGLYLDEESFGTSFNSFQIVSYEGEVYDTGEGWVYSHYTVFYRDSIIIIISGDVNNSFSDDYKEGHEYDSEDPIAEGQSYSGYGKLKISSIKNGVIEDKLIEFSEDYTLQLYIFRDYLVFAADDSEKSVVYKWSEKELNYSVVK